MTLSALCGLANKRRHSHCHFCFFHVHFRTHSVLNLRFRPLGIFDFSWLRAEVRSIQDLLSQRTSNLSSAMNQRVQNPELDRKSVV